MAAIERHRVPAISAVVGGSTSAAPHSGSSTRLESLGRSLGIQRRRLLDRLHAPPPAKMWSTAQANTLSLNEAHRKNRPSRYDGWISDPASRASRSRQRCTSKFNGPAPPPATGRSPEEATVVALKRSLNQYFLAWHLACRFRPELPQLIQLFRGPARKNHMQSAHDYPPPDRSIQRWRRERSLSCREGRVVAAQVCHV